MVITFLWILCVALILLGLAGTVLPVLPGTVLVWGGIVLGAWIDDFARVGMTTVVVVSVLALLAWGLEYVVGPAKPCDPLSDKDFSHFSPRESPRN